MRLTSVVKLLPTVEQRAEIVATLDLFAVVASRAARLGFERKAYGRAGLHRVAYHQLRAEFGVSCSIADLAVKRVAAIFQRDRTVCPTFRPNGSMPCNQDSLRFLPDGTVNMRLRNGRVRVPYVCGERQRALLNTANADVNAAQNIGARAHVDAPMVAERPQEIAA